jgi:hypothetical protein
VFGDVRPAAVTLEQLSEFRAEIARNVSQREAHRVIKIWRALWQVLAALRNCRPDEDPSFGVVNTEPEPRHASWQAWEIARIAKRAWRDGYHGLAALIATAWDGMMSPVDVRAVTPANGLRKAASAQSRSCGPRHRRKPWRRSPAAQTA